MMSQIFPEATRITDATLPPMITIIDYGIGNLRSVQKAFEAVGADVVRTDDPAVIAAAERLVLPGVGAFGACAAEIRRRGLEAPILEAVAQNVPLLGVCAGMQLLFDESEEMGRHQGLGLLPGRVVRFDANGLKVPHMGWNTLAEMRPSPLLDGLDDGAHVYFVHSYYAAVERADDVLAATRYGITFPAVVGRNNILGVQFHPEKSQRAGLRLLENFAFRVVR